MQLKLIADPTPEWIIGQDAAGGDAWLVHARPPRLSPECCNRRSSVRSTPPSTLIAGSRSSTSAGPAQLASPPRPMLFSETLTA